MRTPLVITAFLVACGGAKDSSTTTPTDTGPPPVEETLDNGVCDDGLDNDGDGATDCSDSGCVGGFCACVAFADVYVACLAQTGITSEDYEDHSACADATDDEITKFECLEAAYNVDCSTSKALFNAQTTASGCS